MSLVVVIGAGAIGRGFLPWVLPESAEILFVDGNPRIVQAMNERHRYVTYMAKDGVCIPRVVELTGAMSPAEAASADLSGAALAFCAVGPRSVVAVAPILARVGGPVILCENDPAAVDIAQATTGRSDIVFAVPDVITSNTSPPELLALDPLSVVTEEGTLFVDERAGAPLGDWRGVGRAELDQQWTAKLYLHNTPHCVAAYLGHRVGATYLHEAMRHDACEAIVRGSMNEMLSALKLRWEIPHDFLEWYAAKELQRFTNHLLCDPIARVAREPLRKLSLDGRLIGAARICLAHGILPHNLLLGIASALLFDEPSDPDRQMAFLRRALAPDDLLTIVLGLSRGEALELLLRDQLPNLEARLSRLSRTR